MSVVVAVVSVVVVLVSKVGKGAVELNVVDEAEETPLLLPTRKSWGEGESCVILSRRLRGKRDEFKLLLLVWLWSVVGGVAKGK